MVWCIYSLKLGPFRYICTREKGDTDQMITSHFKQVVPFHPSKCTDGPPAQIKTLRIPFQCGDDWCLNGPPIEGATTYYICPGCSRESTNYVRLAGILREENKRKPFVKNEENKINHLTSQSFEEAIPGFGFEFMANYCIDNSKDINAYGEVNRKAVDAANRLLQYLRCLRIDCKSSQIQLRLGQAEVYKHVRTNMEMYARIYNEDNYYEELLLQNFASASYELFGIRLKSKKTFKSAWKNLKR